MKWFFQLFFILMFTMIIVSYFVFRETQEDIQTTKYTSSNIKFISKNNLSNMLLENKDNYYNTFHKNDLKVRKIKTIEQYHPIIKNSTCNGTYTLKSKIKKCIDKIHEKLSSIKKKEKYGIDIKKFIDIPWKIGFTCDKNYENGFPHTRNDVIILNVSDVSNKSEYNLQRLLVHEKTHVYQKMFKDDVQRYIDTHFKLSGKKNKKDIYKPANPDIDGNIYDDLESKFKYYAKYKKNPNVLSDIQYSNKHPRFEHPLEKIAYDIEDIL